MTLWSVISRPRDHIRTSTSCVRGLQELDMASIRHGIIVCFHMVFSSLQQGEPCTQFCQTKWKCTTGRNHSSCQEPSFAEVNKTIGESATLHCMVTVSCKCRRGHINKLVSQWLPSTLLSLHRFKQLLTSESCTHWRSSRTISNLDFRDNGTYACHFYLTSGHSLDRNFVQVLSSSKSTIPLKKCDREL